jgi:hypothetical protein
VGRETVNGREKHGLDVAVLLRNLCEISPDRIATSARSGLKKPPKVTTQFFVEARWVAA